VWLVCDPLDTRLADKALDLVDGASRVLMAQSRRAVVVAIDVAIPKAKTSNAKPAAWRKNIVTSL
jgi:hypothetical protein